MRTSPIQAETFKAFLADYDSYCHYMHDPLYYDYISGIQETHLLGLYEDDALIGVSMLSGRSVLKRYRIFTSHAGPLIRPFTNDRLQFFLREIDAYAKKHGGIKMIHSPYHIYQMRNSDGEAIDSVLNNHGIMEVYSRLGYSHNGFTKQLVTSEMLRYQAVLDISRDEAELMKSMDQKTRYNTRASEQMGVRVRYLEEDEYDKFIEIYKDTEERIGFDPVSSQKIKNLLRTLKDRTYLTLSYIDLEEYLAKLSEELEALVSDQKDMQSKFDKGEGTKRMKGRLNELHDLVGNKEKRLEKIRGVQAEYGSVIELSAGMYYYNNHEMVYLFSGSYPEHSMFMGTNFTTWHMIKEAKKLGLGRFNFFGLTGDFTEASKDYGVYKFKKGYDPLIEELPGTFEKVYNRPVHKLAQKLNKV
ncbi:peptidoglycan bridge formation glycyltransferase FemA/FemB family protein [Salinicoccus sp. ID82-1]|uniref:Aminoacyltransferase n=1 Tax=Salinicoccus cyprini TaxID=2493691 RepID=A0A558AZC6_9STAP|nr:MULTISPECIES: peptidoglycan bridge formation glycyltransferase FemA/FemB family protein [Salinicoccus]MCG1009168.1 peptidoglycan bridge formation glycyltransferase FemA/FemB family protein [Salinicoccus sp. ID82-1]TVT29611.1 aminoacyltransferase [Salinicoccus cyprini]